MQLRWGVNEIMFTIIFGSVCMWRKQLNLLVTSKSAPLSVKTAWVPSKPGPLLLKTARVPSKPAPLSLRTARVPSKPAPLSVRTA